jgi:hypothetical protein
MSEPFLDQVKFSLARDVLRLGVREKNAVRTVLTGLQESQQTGKVQKPIKITIAPENQFRWRDFTQLMSELGIDVFDSLEKNEIGTSKSFTFQPKLFENSHFLKGVLASKEATDHFIKSFIDYEPSSIQPNPQK